MEYKGKLSHIISLSQFHRDQWNKIEPRNKLIYILSISDNEAKNTQWGMDSFFNKNRKTRQQHANEWNWAPILHHTQKSTHNALKT